MLWGSFSNCATSGGGVHVLVPPTIHTLPSGCFLMLLEKKQKIIKHLILLFITLVVEIVNTIFTLHIKIAMIHHY